MIQRESWRGILHGCRRGSGWMRWRRRGFCRIGWISRAAKRYDSYMTLIASQPSPAPQPHKFTREEYYQMGEMGIFRNQRVELIEGEIIDMAPQKDIHAVAIM